MRVYAEIARRRGQGDDFCAEVLSRIDLLVSHLGDPVDLTDGHNRSAFSDVLDDGFVPENYQLILNPSQACNATMDRGGRIEFTGLLVTGGIQAAELERRIHLTQRYAEHRRIRVQPRYRGNRIAPRCLIRSIRLYERLGVQQVRLRAAYSGRWYWAQWGFHFEDAQELDAVREHAQMLVDVFGGGLDVSTFTHPSQFYWLGGEAQITFDDICAALPERRDPYEELAYDNGLGLHEEISFGRGVLLTGPNWNACLDMAGADKLIFDRRAGEVVGAEGGA